MIYTTFIFCRADVKLYYFRNHIMQTVYKSIVYYFNEHLGFYTFGTYNLKYTLSSLSRRQLYPFCTKQHYLFQYKCSLSSSLFYQHVQMSIIDTTVHFQVSDPLSAPGRKWASETECTRLPEVHCPSVSIEIVDME